MPGLKPTLGPIPPTPAEWREEDQYSSQVTCAVRFNGASPLHIDTGHATQRKSPAGDEVVSAIRDASPQVQSLHLRHDPSMGALARSPAVRNRSAKGIRERRSESRNGQVWAPESSTKESVKSPIKWVASLEHVRPVDLVLPDEGTISRRRTNHNTPGSGKSIGSLNDAPNEVDSRLHSTNDLPLGPQDSSHSTPRPESARLLQQPAQLGFTPSSQTESIPAPMHFASSSAQSSATSTSSCRSDMGHQPMSTSRSDSEERPTSHLLHIPNADGSTLPPLLPVASPTQNVQVELLGPESLAAFSQRANERHHRFAEREAAAANDAERLDLFVQYILAESRIRREKYATVFEDEDIDLAEMMRGLFAQRRVSSDVEPVQPKSSLKRTKGNDSMHASTVSESSMQGSLWHGNSYVGSHIDESPITVSSESSPRTRPESNWWKDYVPCLSPIASMSITTGQDEMGSRGRAPSRWFEDPSRGESGHGDALSVLPRSKRESKYMGVPREARNSTALLESGVAGRRESHGLHERNLDYPAMYSRNEYPLEKTGWHEEAATLSYPPTSLQQTPYASDPSKLDISRLVTLPPPYPRHYPAVNNSHPDLSDERAVVRSLQDLSESNERWQAFQSKIAERRRRAEAWCKHQQSLHEQDMQFRIEHCEISPGGFDQAESEIENKMAQSENEVAQADFDLYQEIVLSPLHAMFSERIKNATSSLDKLSRRLFTDAQQHSPNVPQEEGDDHAELLEKLTQLKWLFEARENLHRETYNLLSGRNDRYKTIVLLPYRQNKNLEKLAEAESFFAKDAHDRKLAFEQAVASRSAAFLAVVETNVTRGVEIQLSAFWDIAPSLLQLLHKIPKQLDGFEIQIPHDEYSENPRYHEHPMQYLFSLLTHAEKSTYQFIESQINLFCLLHEIRSLALAARYRAEGSSIGQSEWAGRTAVGREREEQALTDDLKEKVAVVEGQWVEGLGSRISAERQRIREFLEDTGGWDDEADLG